MTATIQNKSDVLANQAITKTGGNSILLPFERKDVWVSIPPKVGLSFSSLLTIP